MIIVKAREARHNYQLLVKKDISIAEAARRAGISRAALSAIEAGKATPSLDTVGALCRIYGIEVGELLEYEDVIGEGN